MAAACPSSDVSIPNRAPNEPATPVDSSSNGGGTAPCSVLAGAKPVATGATGVTTGDGGRASGELGKGSSGAGELAARSISGGPADCVAPAAKVGSGAAGSDAWVAPRLVANT